MRNIGDVDRQLLLDDAAGLTHARAGMPLRHVDALDNDARFGRQHAQHVARSPLVAPADDDHVVALLDLQLRHIPTLHPDDRHPREGRGPGMPDTSLPPWILAFAGMMNSR